MSVDEMSEHLVQLHHHLQQLLKRVSYLEDSQNSYHTALSTFDDDFILAPFTIDSSTPRTPPHSPRKHRLKVSPTKQLPPLPNSGSASSSLTKTDSGDGLDVVASSIQFDPENYDHWHQQLINFRNDLIKAPPVSPQAITDYVSMIFPPGLLPLAAEQEMGVRILRYCHDAIGDNATAEKGVDEQQLIDMFAFVGRFAKRVQRKRRRESTGSTSKNIG